MTYFNSLVSKLSRKKPVQTEEQGWPDMMNTLFRGLSKSDKNTVHTLEDIYISSQPRIQNSEEDIRLIKNSFASSLYSDKGKRYFAAAHVNLHLILLTGEKFLTEEIIWAHMSRQSRKFLATDYMTGLAKSLHLSERIVDAALQEMSYSEGQWFLGLVPASMITPRVIKTSLSKTVLLENRKFAAI